MVLRKPWQIVAPSDGEAKSENWSKRNVTPTAGFCKAQPCLGAIADSVLRLQDVRNWLIGGSPAESTHPGAEF
jgi:hypothetical protein